MTRASNAPWFSKAGAATSILPISHFVGANIFALKGGGYGCLFSLDGIDPESRTDEDLDVRVRGVEAALRGLQKAPACTSTLVSSRASTFPGRRSTPARSRSPLRTTELSFLIGRPAFAVSTCTGV